MNCPIEYGVSSPGVCVFLGCLIYPVGWNDDNVKRICGSDANVFSLDQCSVRWAYILAIVGAFDVFILAILAFVLSARQAKLYGVKGGDFGGYMLETESNKPSVVLQPVNTVAEPVAIVAPPIDQSDRYSEYSHKSGRSRSKTADFSL